jgi:hypothetical protein
MLDYTCCILWDAAGEDDSAGISLAAGGGNWAAFTLRTPLRELGRTNLELPCLDVPGKRREMERFSRWSERGSRLRMLTARGRAVGSSSTHLRRTPRSRMLSVGFRWRGSRWGAVHGCAHCSATTTTAFGQSMTWYSRSRGEHSFRRAQSMRAHSSLVDMQTPDPVARSCTASG